MTMGVTDVYIFIDRLQSIEGKPVTDCLSFENVYKSCLYTTAKWNALYANSLTILWLLAAVSDTPLDKATYDFNTKFLFNDERMVETFVQFMLAGEAALPILKQVSHQV